MNAGDSHVPSAHGFLARIPTDLRRAILDGARPVRASAGETLFDAVGSGRVGVVVSGRGRRFIAAGDGRQVTTGYVGPADLVGNGPAFGIGMLAVGAVSECVVAEFDASLFSRLVESDQTTRAAFGDATAALAREAHEGLALAAFGTMRERLAHHLLQLAVEDASAVSPIVTVSQQALAQCVGTVREVVARTLREFRSEGLVVVTAGRIELVDRPRLARIATGKWMRADDGAVDAQGMEILDSSPSAIIAVDRLGRVVYANPSAARLLGSSVAQLVGVLVDLLVPPDVRERHQRWLADFMSRERAPRAMAPDRSPRAVRRDGTEIAIACRLVPTETPGGLVVFATLTERLGSTS